MWAARAWRGTLCACSISARAQGCILLTLLAELPRQQGRHRSSAPARCVLPRDNAAGLGRCGSRAAFVAADWLEGLAGRFDLILSNPPYIASG